MIPPLPIDVQITKALDRWKKEHYPHKPTAIYLGFVEYEQLRQHQPEQGAKPTYQGVRVYEVWATDHINIG